MSLPVWNSKCLENNRENKSCWKHKNKGLQVIDSWAMATLQKGLNNK